MSTDPHTVLVIILGEVPLPDLPAGVVSHQAADVAEVLVFAAEVRHPLVVAEAALLATLPPNTPGLKVVACTEAPEALPDDAIGALPLWDGSAASLALGAALKVRERLVEAMEESVRLDDEHEAFVHSVNHDLKGPLQGIMGLAGLLMQQSGVRVFPEVASYAQRIETDAERLAGMVSALTAYARLGRPHVNLRVVSLSELVDEACASAIRRHTERFPRFRVLSELPTVQVDPDLVVEAISRLIDNAVLFSDASSPSVEFAGSVGADGMVTLSVSDQGIGLPEHSLESVFELFTRLDKRRGEGLGVGLTVARRAIELSGGTVTLTSELGLGASAHIRLPAAPAP